MGYTMFRQSHHIPRYVGLLDDSWYYRCHQVSIVASLHHDDWFLRTCSVDFLQLSKFWSLSLKTFQFGWWFGTWILFFNILGISSSQLTFIFFRGVGIQPTRWCVYAAYRHNWRYVWDMSTVNPCWPSPHLKCNWSTLWKYVPSIWSGEPRFWKKIWPLPRGFRCFSQWYNQSDWCHFIIPPQSISCQSLVGTWWSKCP